MVVRAYVDPGGVHGATLWSAQPNRLIVSTGAVWPRPLLPLRCRGQGHGWGVDQLGQQTAAFLDYSRGWSCWLAPRTSQQMKELVIAIREQLQLKSAAWTPGLPETAPGMLVAQGPAKIRAPSDRRGMRIRLLLLGRVSRAGVVARAGVGVGVGVVAAVAAVWG